MLRINDGDETIGFHFSDFLHNSIRAGIFANGNLLNTSRISTISILPYAIHPESYSFNQKTLWLLPDSGAIWHSIDSIYWILRIISIDSTSELVHFEIAKYEKQNLDKR